MTPEQNKTLGRVGKELQVAFPNFFGTIRFNMAKARDYSLSNIEQCVAVEYDGTLIKNLGTRISGEKHRNKGYG